MIRERWVTLFLPQMEPLDHISLWQLKAFDLIYCILFPRLPFGAFLDIFWRIKLKHPEKVVVSCPDVMFETHVQEIPHEKYVALANKWDVKKWINSDGTIRWYGCRRGGRPNDNTASCRKQSGLLVPSCDLENLADMIKFVMKECENAGLLCELNEGSQLGNVTPDLLLCEGGFVLILRVPRVTFFLIHWYYFLFYFIFSLFSNGIIYQIFHNTNITCMDYNANILNEITTLFTSVMQILLL